MTQTAFALFVDVMGTQQELLPTDGRTDEVGLARCRDRLEDFHRDLNRVIEQRLATFDGYPEPGFVAEFSDSAYIVGERFASVAIPALSLMRSALRHTYPLRGGIGIGSFLHETSGVHAGGGQQVRTTSSFLGSAIVTAYQAEQSIAPGLRILVHPHVMQLEAEPLLKLYTVPLPQQESNAASTHELRFWYDFEVAPAISKLRDFRDAQNLTERSTKHYNATIAAYERFGTIRTALPHALPALWL